MAAILMVDDERSILELVKNGLQKDGHFITAYTSAAQVPLDKLNRYDLIILDIMMPDMDGFSYCNKIRSLVDCPILFLTAKTMENDITFGLGRGRLSDKTVSHCGAAGKGKCPLTPGTQGTAYRPYL